MIVDWATEMAVFESTGREINSEAVCFLVPPNFDDERLTVLERRELSDYMIEAWKRWADEEITSST